MSKSNSLYEKKNVVLVLSYRSFNAAEYLCQCLNSSLTQEFSDFELILVNDGSIDASGEIVRRIRGGIKISFIFARRMQD